MLLAANALRATKPLAQALRNALSPGGYLVLLKVIESEPRGAGAMSVGAAMGGLPGWWVGREDSRRSAPTV
jgi:hybrid polyketide synthase/nonribosomal peptide synthetase ACE1